MKHWKIAAVAVLCLAAAACRTEGGASMAGATQATFGTISPAVPDGWTRSVRPGGVIAFSCYDARCRERGEIAYSEMTGPGDTEADMRAAIMRSPSALRDMGNQLSLASGGDIKQIAFKDSSDANAIRFERVFTKRSGNGSEIYITYRTVSGSQSRIVSATAPTLAKARHYMKIGRASFP